MNAEVFRIRFSGQCLPGFDESQVRSLLESRGAFTAAQLSAIFRGSPVTLKQGLALEKAAHYLAQLRKIGMDVAVEPDPSQTESEAWPAPAQAPQQVTPPRPSTAAQPKPATAPQPVQAPPQVTETPDQSTDRTTLWGLSFSGRMNPAHYLLAAFGAYLIQDIFGGDQLIALLTGAKISDPGLFSMLACAFFVFQLTRLSALRLHDLGLPGFLAVAYVALCGFCINTFSTTLGLNLLQCGGLLLIVLPSTARNKYGWTPGAISKPFDWYDPGIRANRIFFLSRIFSVLSIWVVASLLNILILGFFLRMFEAAPMKFTAPSVLIGGYTLQLFLARLHDMGKSGHWLILYSIMAAAPVLMFSTTQLSPIEFIVLLLVFLLEILFFILLAVVPGQASENRFGPAPTACSRLALWGNLTFLALLTIYLVHSISTPEGFQRLMLH